MQVVRIGLDLAKYVFEVHGVDGQGNVVIRKTLRRGSVSTFFANLPPCLVGMEACNGAHYWARVLTALGHNARLISPQFVAPYVKSNKNDRNDAEAICEAVGRPTMRFVPPKSPEQLAIQALHRIRQRLVRSRTKLVNQIRGILAEHGIEQLDHVDSVKIFVGGLPQHPEPPLNYMLVYSLEGALDYYTTLSWVIRDGKRTQVKALSEREPVTFDQLGELEAFHTAGGLSTMAFRYEGKIPSMEYKTLRYPGHAQIMENIRSLGLLDTTPVDVKGLKVAPRDAFIAVVQPKLTKPGGRDLVALRVVVSGSNDGRRATKTFELVDRYDEKHGVSAMMRTTGYSLSITGLMQVRGQVTPPGVCTPDECVPAAAYISELRKRGIDVKES